MVKVGGQVVIEVRTWSPAAGTTEGAVLDADRRVQQEFFCVCPGFLRRTTARDSAGGWADIVLWQDDAAADAAALVEPGHPAVVALRELLADEPAVRRYRSLD